MNESINQKALEFIAKEKALRKAEKLPISEENKEIVKSYFLNLMESDDLLKNSELFLKMPGTITQWVVNDMELNFRAPFQLSLFTFLSFVSAYLLKNNVVINFENEIITPEIWTLILAPSGAGKTLIEKEIRKTLEFESNILEPDTRAGFFQNFQKNNNGFLIIDEIYSFLRSLEEKKDLRELKKDILKIYSKNRIIKVTKTDQIIIDNPNMVFLGLGETKQTLKYLKQDDFTNGFLSRFATIFANLEKEKQKTWRPNRGFKNTKGIKAYWNQIKAFLNDNKEFTVNENAKFAFEIIFEQLNNFKELDSAYKDRLYQSTLKWSLLHCVLENREDCEIRAVDIAYGSYVVLYLQKNILKIFNFYDFLPFEKKKHQMKIIIKRLKSRNKKITVRNILSAGNHWFKSAKDIRYVLDELEISEEHGT